MKLFVAFVAIIAVAAAIPYHKKLDEAELEAVIAAIHSPSTDPATAELLEQQLEAIINGVLPIVVPSPVITKPVDAAPIAVKPVVVDQFQPIAVGPAIIEFPAPVDPISPTPEPLIIGHEVPSQSDPILSPLVQIILNVNNADAHADADADSFPPTIVGTPVEIMSPIVLP